MENSGGVGCVGEKKGGRGEGEEEEEGRGVSEGSTYPEVGM